MLPVSGRRPSARSSGRSGSDVYVYIYIYIYAYIYIYIYRERERYRYTCIYIYIYTHVNLCTNGIFVYRSCVHFVKFMNVVELKVVTMCCCYSICATCILLGTPRTLLYCNVLCGMVSYRIVPYCIMLPYATFCYLLVHSITLDYIL